MERMRLAVLLNTITTIISENTTWASAAVEVDNLKIENMITGEIIEIGTPTSYYDEDAIISGEALNDR